MRHLFFWTLIVSTFFSPSVFASFYQYKIDLTIEGKKTFEVEFSLDEKEGLKEINNPNEILIQKINYFGESRVFLSTTDEGLYYSAEFLINKGKLSRSCMVHLDGSNELVNIVDKANYKLYLWSVLEMKYVELKDQSSLLDKSLCEKNL